MAQCGKERPEHRSCEGIELQALCAEQAWIQAFQAAWRPGVDAWVKLCGKLRKMAPGVRLILWPDAMTLET